MRCELCHTEAELRPYGARGEMICFQCAFATPEAKAATERAFEQQLEAAGPFVLIGEETGQRPATTKERQS